MSEATQSVLVCYRSHRKLTLLLGCCKHSEHRAAATEVLSKLRLSLLSLVLTLSLHHLLLLAPTPSLLPSSSGPAGLGCSDSCHHPTTHPEGGQSNPGPVQRPATPHYQAERSAISPMDSAERQAFAGVMDGPEATISASCPLLGPQISEVPEKLAHSTLPS